MSVLQTWSGLTTRNTAQQVGIDLVLRVWTAGVGPRRHAGQPHCPHQPLYPLAIDDMARRLEKDHHLAAAVERMPCVFFVDQATEQQIAFIDRPGLLPRIDRGARYSCQHALPDHWHRIPFVDPRLPHHDRLIPDFFFSQSSSTFSLPISLYSRSGSRCAATACRASLAFKQRFGLLLKFLLPMPDRNGCTPYS